MSVLERLHCTRSQSLHVTVYSATHTHFLDRLRSAKFTDRRVCIMNEVITGIRVIKMYAWEYAFKDVVNYLRK